MRKGQCVEDVHHFESDIVNCSVCGALRQWFEIDGQVFGRLKALMYIMDTLDCTIPEAREFLGLTEEAYKIDRRRGHA